ncbi:hypothetical protein [Sphingomonas sp.]|uniref:hypothetical protein n=1 Tax=Sphingomonas sp. TaxID=28214 RepID=UPI00307D7B5C
MADLQSGKALVCHQQHRADCGVGTVWFVCLADGYLIDCGAERHSEARANALANIINASGPDALGKAALSDWRLP